MRCKIEMFPLDERISFNNKILEKSRLLLFTNPIVWFQNKKDEEKK